MAGTVQKDKRDESVRRILDAALEAFAQVGYEGARVDAIAKDAGVNKAMIYYRVGDKKTLYEAVLHDVFGDAAQRLRARIEGSDSPEEQLKVFISDIGITFARRPHFVRIMMREAAAGWTHCDKTIAEDISGLFKVLKGILDRGVDQGVFVKNDSLAVYMMIIGPLIVSSLAVPIQDQFYSVLDDPATAPGSLCFDNIVTQVLHMVLSALSRTAGRAVK